MPHYFENGGGGKKEYHIAVEVCGQRLSFITADGVFSKGGLDKGTAYLLDTVLGHIGEGRTTIADIGCGYGVLGVTIAVVRPNIRCIMTDVNEKAAELANANAAANGVGGRAAATICDGLAGINEKIGCVVTNPPFRAGKQTVIRFFSQSHDALEDSGVLYAVLRKQQGAESYMREISNIFGNIEILLKKKGYIVIRAVKTGDN